MTDEATLTELSEWQAVGQQRLQFGDYTSACRSYESAIAQYPDERGLYWQYGIALLLNQQLEDAQTTWLMVLAAAEDEPSELLWRAELQQALHQAVAWQVSQGQLTQVYWIRQCLRELEPWDSDNLLHLLIVAVETQLLTLETLLDWSVVENLQSSEISDQPLLLCALDRYLSVAFPHAITIDLTTVLAKQIQDTAALADLIFTHSQRIGHIQRYTALAQGLLQIGLERQPHHFESLLAYSNFAQQEYDYSAAIQAAQRAVDLAQSALDRITAMNTLLCAFLTSGQQDGRFQQLLKDYRHCLSVTLPLLTSGQSTPGQTPAIKAVLPSSELPEQTSLTINGQISLTRTEAYRLLVSTMCLPYIEDSPQTNRSLQNQVVQLCEQTWQQIHDDIFTRYQQAHQSRRLEPSVNAAKHVSEPLPRLKVGYICRYFYQHSVGWLARWLLKHHDSDRIDLYIYIINPQRNPDLVQQQYLQLSEHVVQCPLDALHIAKQIHHDKIDILVELDSLTCEVTCEVMALKPAPVQVSWLGWDASGLSTIDYFIADDYVLPEMAQENYPENILRLPQSYIAVEGFEVGVPNLHRSALGIPDDAITFMTAQRGYKRHREMMQLQLQILQQVPRSYLLIKGLADQSIVQKAFRAMAAPLNIDPRRLIFLPLVESESIHRANLTIADIILDTYPYNGATTSLEALWMERPIVTLVGQQFAARNSYTMLKNVGVDAGIAWTQSEYVDWAVRLATDETLRQAVVWQLRQAKQTAPLWNVEQFAAAVETHYFDMWQAFQDAD